MLCEINVNNKEMHSTKAAISSNATGAWSSEAGSVSMEWGGSAYAGGAMSFSIINAHRHQQGNHKVTATTDVRLELYDKLSGVMGGKQKLVGTAKFGFTIDDTRLASGRVWTQLLRVKLAEGIVGGHETGIVEIEIAIEPEKISSLWDPFTGEGHRKCMTQVGTEIDVDFCQHVDSDLESAVDQSDQSCDVVDEVLEKVQSISTDMSMGVITLDELHQGGSALEVRLPRSMYDVKWAAMEVEEERLEEERQIKEKAEQQAAEEKMRKEMEEMIRASEKAEEDLMMTRIAEAQAASLKQEKIEKEKQKEERARLKDEKAKEKEEKMKRLERDKEARKGKATTKMDRIARRTELEVKYGKEGASAAGVQAMVRGKQAKTKVKKMTAERKSAVVVQKIARGKQAKVRVKKMTTEKKSAMVVQKVARGKQARARVKKKNAAIKSVGEVIQQRGVVNARNAAVGVQKIIRGKQAKKRVQQIGSERKSAVLLQKVERGRQQRKKLPPPSSKPPPPSSKPPQRSGIKPTAKGCRDDQDGGESASGEEASGEEASGEEASGEEASGEEASGEEASGEEASGANELIGTAWIYEDPLFELPEEVVVEVNTEGVVLKEGGHELKCFRWADITGHECFVDDSDEGACDLFTFWVGEDKQKYALEVDAAQPFIDAFTR
jgi:hypothetical protein